MEGVKGKTCVCQLIIRVTGQLKAGVFSLIETSSEKAGATKARLDSMNKKHRKRHTRDLMRQFDFRNLN